jgi:ATP-binding cassette, subfamily B, bacterial
MGFYSSLNQEKYDRQYSDRELVRRIWPFIRPQLRKLILISITVLIMSATGALYPVVVARGVGMLEEQPELTGILMISGAVLLLGLINWLTNWIRRRLTIRAIANVLLNLANTAFKAATKHDLSFYDQFSSGRIQSRITTDTREFGNMVVMITDLVSQVVEMLVLGVILLTIEWRLALILFTIIPLVFVLAISYRHLARKVTKRGMEAMADVNSSIKETVSGIAVAKNFRQEMGIYGEFDRANQTSFKVNLFRGIILALLWPGLNLLGGVMSAVLVYFGGLSAAEGVVTAGAWYLFLLSLDRFLFPVISLSTFWANVQAGLSAAERVFALIDAEPAVVQTDQKAVSGLKGEIEFDHVNFRYKSGEPVLDDFTLKIRPGENVALVGHTGAGKSSIARLIARFYEYQEGSIRVDGRDIRTFDLTQYRKQLGIVSQTPFLFSGTVLDNIHYACDVCDDDIYTLANQIGGGDWVETLPNGLLSEVGERGARLSMGQRQLVSLMRVLVQKPAIFILDEATASIDPFTERQIQEALNLILQNSTSILIAHRLSTVKAVDRIIVMDHGKIKETGNHEALLEQGGLYANLYNTYFRHQSLEYRPEGLDEFLQYKLDMGLKDRQESK